MTPRHSALWALALAGCATLSSAPPPGLARLSHGVAVGEVSAQSAVLWGRCDAAATLRVQVDDGPMGATDVTEADDLTGRILLPGLSPGRSGTYFAWCGPETEPPADPMRLREGSFRTAVAAQDRAPVRLAWGGDLGGQNACRDAVEGYSIFRRVLARRPDLFIGLGDMIYADSSCNDVGLFGNAQVPGPPRSGSDVESIRAHWRYNRADPALQELLARTAYYAVWDDHEIANDAGPHHSAARYARAEPRLAPARRAFLDYQPLVDTGRLYRSVRWGKHLELFLLDTRSYRDANSAPDTGPVPKSMLGAAQRDWLVESVRRSDATWKVVVSSVPLSIPTGSKRRGRDGWANFDGDGGFERELLAMLQAWRDAGVRDVVFLSTDVHFATGFAYAPFPDFSLLEYISGPLNAGMLPTQDYDDTLKPRRLFSYGPPAPKELKGMAAARRYFNFGELEIDAAGALVARIVNGDGEVVYEGRHAAAPPPENVR